VAPYRLHPPADESPAEAGGRHALEDDRIVGDVRLDDSTARRHLLGRAARRLDLWKFRHGGSSGTAGRARAYPSPSWGGAPPSITMVSPFMNEDAAEARKMQGWAISSTLPQRPMPTRAATVS